MLSAPSNPVSLGPERRQRFLAPFLGLVQQIEQARDIGAVYPMLEPAPMPGWVSVAGERAVSLVANDYLDLARDPRVAEAMSDAGRRYGGSRCASPLVGGYTESHRALENELAGFLGQQRATLFASGYQANLGVLGALMRPGDLVVCDLFDHASIVDGARLAGAEVRYFAHNNPKHLDAVLTEAGDRRVLVVVEGVYSADGDIAALAELCAVAHRHGALLIVDEAHSLGVLGPNGGGAAQLCDVVAEVDLVVGTMSKSMGMVGGFAAGDASLIELIAHAGRSLVFSAAISPVLVAGALRSLRLMRTEPWRRERLWHNTHRLLAGIDALGLDTLGSVTPVVPLLVGDPELTLRFARGLADAGVLVCPAIPPMVQAHRSRVRMHVTAGHDDEAVDHTLRAIDEVASRVGIPRTKGLAAA